MSEEHPGLKVFRMPRRYSIPLLGRYLYWRLHRKIKFQMADLPLDNIVIATGIPKDKWQGTEVGLRSSEPWFR